MSSHSLERRPPWAAFAIAAGLAALGLVLIWDAAGLRQGGGYSGVGPGSMPRLIGGGLVFLAVWTLVAGFRGDMLRAPPQQPGPVLWVLAGLVAQIALLYWAGFVIASAALFALTARGFGQRNLPLAFGIGLGMSLIIYGLFDRLLKLNLPGGPLENLLFGG